ncbi:MAG: hypothetical protein DDT37_01529 [Firmicutes bacterium]|nr:hypothetical protein [candidate division NPL-UPA2 bacterium]MBT9156543.1 hypothetical protein [candidate division NPL-UPA2 bacterium]
MENERLQILKLVQEGKVTPDEATKLLQALEGKSADKSVTTSSGKMLRIRVTESGGTKVNLNLPMSIVEAAVDLGIKFVPGFVDEFVPGFVPGFVNDEKLRGIDLTAVMEAIKQGLTGKIVEVDSEEAKVEISVE